MSEDKEGHLPTQAVKKDFLTERPVGRRSFLKWVLGTAIAMGGAYFLGKASTPQGKQELGDTVKKVEDTVENLAGAVKQGIETLETTDTEPVRQQSEEYTNMRKKRDAMSNLKKQQAQDAREESERIKAAIQNPQGNSK